MRKAILAIVLGLLPLVLGCTIEAGVDGDRKSGAQKDESDQLLPGGDLTGASTGAIVILFLDSNESTVDFDLAVSGFDATVQCINGTFEPESYTALSHLVVARMPAACESTVANRARFVEIRSMSAQIDGGEMTDFPIGESVGLSFTKGCRLDFTPGELVVDPSDPADDRKQRASFRCFASEELAAEPWPENPYDVAVDVEATDGCDEPTFEQFYEKDGTPAQGLYTCSTSNDPVDLSYAEFEAMFEDSNKSFALVQHGPTSGQVLIRPLKVKPGRYEFQLKPKTEEPNSCVVTCVVTVSEKD